MIYLDFFAMTKNQTDRECRLPAGYCASKNDDEKILTTHNMLQAASNHTMLLNLYTSTGVRCNEAVQ